MESEKSVEITAPSADEAVIIGLTRMGVTRDEVHIEILDEGSRGFLGLGTRVARVRLTRVPAAVEKVSSGEDTTVEETSVAESTVTPDRSTEKAHPQTAVTVSKPKSEQPIVNQVIEKSKVETVVNEPSSDSESGTEGLLPKSYGDVNLKDLDSKAVEKATLGVAEHLFDGLRVSVSLAWRQEDRPTLWVAVRGRDANMLVGPRAQTLSSVQYLFRTLVHRFADGDYNLVVDADGYRTRRRRSLETLAQKKADQAVSSGRTIRLRPMPAHERRVIHMVLRQDKRVQTESIGRGRSRAITVIPVKKASG